MNRKVKLIDGLFVRQYSRYLFQHFLLKLISQKSRAAPRFWTSLVTVLLESYVIALAYTVFNI